jgi:hypothetical protein
MSGLVVVDGYGRFIAPNEKARLVDGLIGVGEARSLRLTQPLRFAPPITMRSGAKGNVGDDSRPFGSLPSMGFTAFLGPTAQENPLTQKKSHPKVA